MHIMKCEKCHTYTLKTNCCNELTQRVIPPKYSVPDKYAKYRRLAKENVESNNQKES